MVSEDHGVVLFSDWTTITCFDASGLSWTSERLAYDELSITGLKGEWIHTRGWDAPRNANTAGTVALATGRRVGGISSPGR